MMRSKNILVPLDGSKLAERAAAPAMMLANAMSAKVTFLRVVVPLSLNLDPAFYQRIIEIRTDEAEQYLQKAQYRWSLPPVEIELDTVVGSPAKAIINYVQQNEIDLLLMSSYGRSGIGRRLFGSVSERVLRRAPCATVIIRTQAETVPFALGRILSPLDGLPPAKQALVAGHYDGHQDYSGRADIAARDQPALLSNESNKYDKRNGSTMASKKREWRL